MTARKAPKLTDVQREHISRVEREIAWLEIQRDACGDKGFDLTRKHYEARIKGQRKRLDEIKAGVNFSGLSVVGGKNVEGKNGWQQCRK